MERNDLITYISKSNDRNIQRQKAAGFSIWAIIAAMAYIAIRAIDDSFIILDDQCARHWFLPILTIIINLGYCVILFFVALIVSTSRRTIRLMRSTSDVFLLRLFEFWINIFYLIYGILNIYVVFLSFRYGLPMWLFLTFGIFYLHNPIFFGSKEIWRYFSYFMDFKKYKLQIREYFYWRASYGTVYAFLLIVISIIGFILIYLFLSNISMPLESEQLKVSIKLSSEIFSLSFLLLLLPWQIQEWGKNNWLLEFEKEIYLKDLSMEDIKERLETEIIGSDIRIWIGRQREKYLDVLKGYSDVFSDFQKKLHDPDKIKDVKDYDALIKILKKERSKYKKDFDRIVRRILSIIHIIRADEIPEYQKISDGLLETVTKIKEQIIEINKRLAEIRKTIKK